MNGVVRSPVSKEAEAQMRHFYQGMGFPYLISRREELKDSPDSEHRVRVRVLDEMISEYEAKIKEHYAAMDDLSLEAAHCLLVNSSDLGDHAKARIIQSIMKDR